MAQPQQTLDFSSKFDKMNRLAENKLTALELEELEREQRIVTEKLAEVEKSRQPIQIFTDPFMKLVEKSK